MAARELFVQLLPHLLDSLEPDIEEMAIYDLVQNDPLKDIFLAVLSQISCGFHRRDDSQSNGGDGTFDNFAALNGLMEIDSAESENESQAEQVPAPAILPVALNPNDFHDLFRMPRSSFEELLQILMNDPSSNSMGNENADRDRSQKPETPLMITLYYLGTRHSIKEVASTFQVHN